MAPDASSSYCRRANGSNATTWSRSRARRRGRPWSPTAPRTSTDMRPWRSLHAAYEERPGPAGSHTCPMPQRYPGSSRGMPGPRRIRYAACGAISRSRRGPVAEFLREELGNEWFALRDEGDLLREVWSLGQEPTADELLRDAFSAEED